MAKSKVRLVRLPPDLESAVEVELSRRGLAWSEWVRAAIIEKLKHSARSRKVEQTDLVQLRPDLPMGSPLLACSRCGDIAGTVDHGGVRLCPACVEA